MGVIMSTRSEEPSPTIREIIAGETRSRRPWATTLRVALGTTVAVVLGLAAFALPGPGTKVAVIDIKANADAFNDPSLAAQARNVATSPSGDVGKPHLFFGFLEFDWDGNAPGGVAGFGPLTSPVP